MQYLSIKTIIAGTAICFGIMSCAALSSAQIAAGGTYSVTQTVLASGGASGTGASGGGTYSVESTVGQSAGANQQNGAFAFKSGFWTSQPSGTTAATVSVTGRIIDSNGAGIRNVRVTLTGLSGGARTALSGPYGYFRFDDVAAGNTYVFSVAAKRYTFSQASLVRSITDETDDIIFTADDLNRSFPGEQ